MPRKRKQAVGGRKRRVHRKRNMRGRSWFTDIFTKHIPRAATTVYNKAIVPVHRFARDNHLYSGALGLIPHPAGKVAAAGARALGYGRRRRRAVGKGRFPLLHLMKDVIDKARVGARKLGYGRSRSQVFVDRMRGKIPKVPTGPIRTIGGRRKRVGAGRSALNGRLFLL